MIVDSKKDSANPQVKPNQVHGSTDKMGEKKDDLKPSFARKTDDNTVVGKIGENSSNPATQEKKL